MLVATDWRRKELNSEDLSDYCGNASKCRDPSSLSTTRHRSRVLAAAKASMSFNAHSPTRNVHSAQYTVSNTHSCNKRAHIAQNMYTVNIVHIVHTVHMCHSLLCTEVAQVHRWPHVGAGLEGSEGLGAGGLRGITPPIIWKCTLVKSPTNVSNVTLPFLRHFRTHLKTQSGERWNKCNQCIAMWPQVEVVLEEGGGLREITPTNHTSCPCHTPSHPSRQHLTPIILVNNTQAFANRISKSSSWDPPSPKANHIIWPTDYARGYLGCLMSGEIIVQFANNVSISIFSCRC